MQEPAEAHRHSDYCTDARQCQVLKHCQGVQSKDSRLQTDFWQHQFVCQGGVRSIGSGMEVPSLPEQIGVEQNQSIGLRSWAIVNSGLLCWASASTLMSLGWGHQSSLQWRRAFPVLTANIEADLRGHAGQPGPGRLMKAAALRQALAQS